MLLNYFARDHQDTQFNYTRFLHILLSLAQSNTPSLSSSPLFSSSKHTYRLQTRGLPVCLAEDLVIYSQAERKKRGRSMLRFEGAGLDVRLDRAESAHSELGLIYFINQDYKFNLQTRGQNFSLRSGPWRTAGLVDHSYY